MPPLVARKRNTIMRDGSSIVKQRQLAVRREMDRRGISLKATSMDSGIPYPTLASYFPADPHADPAQIPGGAIYALCGVLPADLVSLFLPTGFAIVRAPEGVDYDELEDVCRDYLETKGRAHHENSPAGRDISPCERDLLNVKVIPLRGTVAA